MSTILLCLYQRIFSKSVLYKYCGRCGLGMFGPDTKVWEAPLKMVMCLKVV